MRERERERERVSERERESERERRIHVNLVGLVVIFLQLWSLTNGVG